MYVSKDSTFTLQFVDIILLNLFQCQVYKPYKVSYFPLLNIDLFGLWNDDIIIRIQHVDSHVGKIEELIFEMWKMFQANKCYFLICSFNATVKGTKFVKWYVTSGQDGSIFSSRIFQEVFNHNIWISSRIFFDHFCLNVCRIRIFICDTQYYFICGHITCQRDISTRIHTFQTCALNKTTFYWFVLGCISIVYK